MEYSARLRDRVVQLVREGMSIRRAAVHAAAGVDANGLPSNKTARRWCIAAGVKSSDPRGGARVKGVSNG